MKVAVVTPYFKEAPDILRRCHDSVVRQTAPCTHIMVADGHPRDEVRAWGVQHFELPVSHRDYGNTPRALGSLSALNQGFDAVAYLDADNWYDPSHIESLLSLVRQHGCDAAFSARVIVLPSGEVVPYEDFDVLDRRHVDTSCMLLTARAARPMAAWALMEPTLGSVGDRVVLAAIRRQGLRCAWSDRRTLFYETRWPRHYEALHKNIPEDVHELDFAALERHDSRRSIDRIGFDPAAEVMASF